MKFRDWMKKRELKKPSKKRLPKSLHHELDLFVKSADNLKRDLEQLKGTLAKRKAELPKPEQGKKAELPQQKKPVIKTKEEEPEPDKEEEPQDDE